MKNGKPIIYFAGKIGKGDWRSEIFHDERIGGLEFPAEQERYLFDESYTVDKGDFLYGGPFFVSCDHGCFHLEDSGHGAGAEYGCGGGYNSEAQTEQTRQKIWRVNRSRLLRADVIFAYVNESDCYGTFVEIGMAQAQRKAVVIGFGDNVPADVQAAVQEAKQAILSGEVVVEEVFE